MSSAEKNVYIETDLFLFEAPEGWEIEALEEDAELVGPNDEFMVISTYELDESAIDEQRAEFPIDISNAMQEATEEAELTVIGKLKKETAPNGLPIWSIQADASDEEQFFDQYATIKGDTAVLITVEGDLEDRPSSALVEEAVYCIEFK